MHILLYERNAYNQSDFTNALKEAGIKISTFQYKFDDKNRDDAFLSSFIKLLKDTTFDTVFSINYYPLLAEGCYQTNTKYISWSYDCPLDVRNIEDTLGFSTNYVFLFDKIQAYTYIDKGFENVYHLPLAINTNRLDQMKPTHYHASKYGGDVAFVGSLYESVYPELIKILPDYIKGYLDSMCETQLLLYGCFFLDNTITSELLDSINKVYHEVYPKENFHIIREELSFTMATQITNYERTRLLKMLSLIPDTKINLFSKNSLEDKSIINKGTVAYLNEMPYVFKTNKINLNISLKCIQSGIPLRALDILGCGGFLLSNYQPELLEYFTPNVDCAVYSSMEEAKELTKYYLKHEEERKKIARHGYETAKEYFNYEKQLKQIFEVVKI